MNVNYYSNTTISLPLKDLTLWAVSEIHQEMLKRRPEALRSAPEPVVCRYDEVLQSGSQLLQQEQSCIKPWEIAMRRLEEVLSSHCAYDLGRWLAVFGGLRLVLEREARRRQRAREMFSQEISMSI
jgi:hypothetical protein